ncbi:MAG TPA: PD-(D/E)XK nuclease family protein [Casimicrobiaceae bacterium]|nr:PD-(D/E)XK nuclease family protein [Casimicrobiaceae bacterium]
MPHLPEPLLRALADGATVVTPNRRLARGIVALYDRSQRDASRVVWPAGCALPWDAWLVALWQDALAAGAVPAGLRLRTPAQAAHAWRRIVAVHATPLVDPDGAAALAAEAWSTLHAWGEGGESWRAWSGGEGDDDDRAAFARWASRYARELAAEGAIDSAQLGDRLGAWAPGVSTWRRAAVVLAGFAELSPQQERLCAALAAAGAAVTRSATLPAAAGRVRHATGATPGDEVARALAWARDRALADPDATIGIAIADLATRREEIRARAEDVLCPALQWPGRDGVPRPYNLSLGAPLASVPLVAVALELLGWADGPLPLGRAAAALRAPYLGATDAWLRRAQFEVDWLSQGRRTISLRAAQSALRGVDRTLAERWAHAIERAAPPATGSPRGHAQAWRAWLEALGWPGSRTQDSAEHQALRAWDRELAEFTTLGAIEPRLSRAAALAAFRAHLAAVVFQPEAPRAQVQIVGLLEAAGLPFDVLWVAGLAAETWPPAPDPHPLLPVAWQRLRNVPRSSAARELAYARELTLEFARAAPEVVFSHPAMRDDHRCSPSPLVPPPAEPPWPDVPPHAGTARAQFEDRASREAIADDFAPRLAVPMRVRGGARLVEAQSDCPFKAVALHRLAAEPWPAPIDGLSAQERGTLVHAALAAFWRDVGTQRALAALSADALGAAAAAAAESARAALPAARWRSMVPVIAAGEAARIAALIADWLDAHERGRPPFAVVGVEKGLPLDLHGLLVSLRLDRVDALEDGGVAIIDYKTGKAHRAETWFESRPQAPQLGLYALAHRAAAPGQPVRAVAYAQVRTGELAVRGLAADDEAWPALPPPAKIRGARLASWTDALAHWAEAVAGLADEIVSGRATVTPRDPRMTCARCGLQPLCRIGAPGLREGGGDDD